MEEIAMGRMKLLFWSETFYPTIGGTEMALWRQTKELLRLGNKIIIVTPDKSKELSPPVQCKKGDYQRIELNHRNHIVNATKKIKSLTGVDLLYITRIFKIDPLGHLRAIKEISRNTDTVLRIPTQGNLDTLRQYPLNNFLDSVAGFICLNDGIEEEIKRYVRFPRIFPHRNGIPTIDFLENKFSRDGSYLFVGRLTETKGVSILLKAWRKYRSLGGRKQLILCGISNFDYRVDELNDGRFLKHHDIKYIKGVDDVWQNVENIYSLIIPSLREGHSNVMLEAMAFGIPIIASNIPGLKEDMAKSCAGVLFQSGGIHELSKRMTEFDKHKYDLEKMSMNGQRFIRNNRTIAHTVENLCHIIKEAKTDKRGV